MINPGSSISSLQKTGSTTPINYGSGNPFLGMTNDNFKTSSPEKPVGTINPNKARQLIFQNKITGIEEDWSYTPPLPRISNCFVLKGIPDTMMVISNDQNQFRSNLASINTKTGRVNWEKEMKGEVNLSSPEVKDGKLMLGTFKGKAYSLDVSNGEEKLLVDPGKNWKHQPVFNEDGVIYSSFDGKEGRGIKAIDSDNGNVLWENDPGLPAGKRVHIGPDGNIYTEVITDTNTLVSIDGQTGKTRWELKDGQYYSSSAAFAPNKTMYLENNSIEIVAVDTETGKNKWKIKRDYRVRSLAADSDSSLYGTDWGGKAFKLDPDTGKTLWETPVGKWVGNIKFDKDGNMVFASKEGFYCLDSKSGKIKWQKSHNNGEWDSLVDIDDKGNHYATGKKVTCYKPSIDKASERIEEENKENSGIKQTEEFVIINGVKVKKKQK